MYASSPHTSLDFVIDLDTHSTAINSEFAYVYVYTHINMHKYACIYIYTCTHVYVKPTCLA